MVESGWKVLNGKAFGKKKSMTIARLQGNSDPEILDHLNRSPVNSYKDFDFKN
jgi:hypothetical protein